MECSDLGLDWVINQTEDCCQIANAYSVVIRVTRLIVKEILVDMMGCGWNSSED